MKKIIIKISMLISMLSLVACTTDMGRFTSISTNNANLNAVNHAKYVKAKGVSSYTCFLFIPFGELDPNLHKATYDALKHTNGDILTDAQAEEFFLGLWPIIWTSGVQIEGKSHNSRGVALKEMFDENGKKK